MENENKKTKIDAIDEEIIKLLGSAEGFKKLVRQIGKRLHDE